VKRISTIGGAVLGLAILAADRVSVRIAEVERLAGRDNAHGTGR
jgi:hypothetical protein